MAEEKTPQKEKRKLQAALGLTTHARSQRHEPPPRDRRTAIPGTRNPNSRAQQQHPQHIAAEQPQRPEPPSLGGASRVFERPSLCISRTNPFFAPLFRPRSPAQHTQVVEISPVTQICVRHKKKALPCQQPASRGGNVPAHFIQIMLAAAPFNAKLVGTSGTVPGTRMVPGGSS